MNIAEQMRNAAIIELEVPGFVEGQTFTLKVKKASLMSLATEGQIPNSLMGVATQIVGTKKTDNKQMDIKEIGGMLDLYCKACLVEPKYEEIKDIMSDEQKFAIFNFGVSGVVKLSNFRKDTQNGASDNDGEGVQL